MRQVRPQNFQNRGSARAILDWLHSHPLPACARRSAEEIDPPFGWSGARGTDLQCLFDDLPHERHARWGEPVADADLPAITFTATA